MLAETNDALAVVTGAGAGIGRATALRLHGLGMRLALLDIDAAALEETRTLFPDPARHGAHRVDVSDPDAMADTARRILRTDGPPTLVVSNAGVLGPPERRAWELTDSDWRGVVGVNLFGAIHCARFFVPAMLEAAVPAHLVFVSSTAGLLPGRRAAAYGASKHALVGYATVLRAELSAVRADIGVSIVCPGAVRTGMNRGLAPNGGEAEILEPAQVADAVYDAAARRGS